MRWLIKTSASVISLQLLSLIAQTFFYYSIIVDIDPKSFGVYSISVSIGVALPLLLEKNLIEYVTYANDIYNSKKYYIKVILKIYIIFFGIMALLSLSSIFIADYYQEQLIVFYIFILNIRIFFIPVKIMILGTLRKFHYHIKISTTELFGRIFSILITIFLLKFGFGIFSLIILHLIYELILVLALIIVYFKNKNNFVMKLNNLKSAISSNKAKLFRSFTFWGSIENLLAWFYVTLDYFLISNELDFIDLGKYQFVMSIAILILGITFSPIIKMLYPLFIDNIESKDIKTYLLFSTRIISYATYFVIASGIFLIRAFYYFSLDYNWKLSDYIIEIILIQILIRAIAIPIQEMIRAKGRIDLIGKMWISYSIFQIAISIFSIKYGLFYFSMFKLFGSLVFVILNILLLRNQLHISVWVFISNNYKPFLIGFSGLLIISTNIPIHIFKFQSDFGQNVISFIFFIIFYFSLLIFSSYHFRNDVRKIMNSVSPSL